MLDAVLRVWKSTSVLMVWRICAAETPASACAIAGSAAVVAMGCAASAGFAGAAKPGQTASDAKTALHTMAAMVFEAAAGRREALPPQKRCTPWMEFTRAWSHTRHP
jgi:hypothetical protein